MSSTVAGSRRSKQRCWRCPCCQTTWARKKTETYEVFCQTCRKSTVKGFGYRTPINCRHQRATHKVEQWAKSYKAYPRTRTGRRLNPPAEVKRAWAEVRKAKTRPAIIRRTERFLTLLLEYTRDDRYTERWSKTLKYADGRVEEYKHRGGLAMMPTVEMKELGRHTLGRFRRDILRGQYTIQVSPSGHKDSDGLSKLDHFRATIIHEVQHLLDDEAHTEQHGHDDLWRKRLHKLYQMFPPTQYGTRLTEAQLKKLVRP